MHIMIASPVQGIVVSCAAAGGTFTLGHTLRHLPDSNNYVSVEAKQVRL